jgi:hypothetical protein
MAERVNKLQKKVDSTEVQGKGSWVLLRSPVIDDLTALEMPPEGDRKASIEFGRELLKSLVMDWDWVDDEGNPLPKPPDEPEILARIPLSEVMFLIGAIGLDDLVDQKN